MGVRFVCVRLSLWTSRLLGPDPVKRGRKKKKIVSTHLLRLSIDRRLVGPWPGGQSHAALGAPGRPRLLCRLRPGCRKKAPCHCSRPDPVCSQSDLPACVFIYATAWACRTGRGRAYRRESSLAKCLGHDGHFKQEMEEGREEGVGSHTHTEITHE